jgi:hypothetical protein
MDENIKIAEKIFGDLNTEEKRLVDEYIGMLFGTILIAKTREQGRQSNLDALTGYISRCAERTGPIMEMLGSRLTAEDQERIESSISQDFPSIFDVGNGSVGEEEDRAGADEDSSDDAKPRKSVFSSCVVSAAIDLSAEDQEQVAQAIAMVAHHAIANKVTDVEGAISLLGSVPEDVAEALGRFGAKVVDKLPAELRLQMEKQ